MSASNRSRINRLWRKMRKAKARAEAKGRVLVEEDIVEFCEKRLGFKPTSYQIELFRSKARFSVVRWCRQSGKSTAIAALILHHLLTYPGSRIAVLAPAIRQPD